MTESGVIPTPEDRSHRARHAAALQHPCGFCGAETGQPCINTASRQPMTIPHYTRTPLVREDDA